jgi:hypothetical protein
MSVFIEYMSVYAAYRSVFIKYKSVIVANWPVLADNRSVFGADLAANEEFPRAERRPRQHPLEACDRTIILVGNTPTMFHNRRVAEAVRKTNPARAHGSTAAS